MKRIRLIALFLMMPALTVAQQQGVWKGKQCAVVLTYDDAVAVHLDNAIPVLDSLALKATFYLSGYSTGFSGNVGRWRSAAANGHELANHTLFHPCLGNIPGRDWVKPEYDMSRYTVQRMTDEMRMTNILLNTVDGRTERTFAYPCGDTMIGGVDYYKTVAGDFVAARGTKSEMKKITEIDFDNVGSYAINGESGEQLVDLVKQAEASGSLLVFLFHGVGGGHSLNVALPAHNQLLRYLKQRESTIWVAPFMDVVKYAKGYTSSRR